MKLLKKNVTTNKFSVFLVDKDDGFSPEIDVLTPTVYFSIDGGAPFVPTHSWAQKSSANMPGSYLLSWTSASESNSAGEVEVRVIKSGVSKEFRDRFTLVPQNVYAALVEGTDTLQTDVIELVGSAASAAKLEKATRPYKEFTVKTGSTSTALLTDSFTEATTDHFKGRFVLFLTGALANGAALECKPTKITASTFSSPTTTLTVESLGEPPANGDVALLI